MILKRIDHCIKWLFAVRGGGRLEKEARCFLVVHPSDLATPLVALEIIEQAGHHVGMDIEVVFLEFETTEGDDLLAGSYDEITE